MKKTATIIIACLLVLVLSCAAFAEETVITADSSTKSGSMRVSYEAVPSYTVVIPAEVSLPRDSYACDGRLAADSVVLGHGQALEVGISGTFLADSADGSDNHLAFSATCDEKELKNNAVAATFVPGDDTSHALRFSASAPPVAGDYAGTVTFTFRVVDSAD